MRQYITWQTFWLNSQEGRHIDANINMNWNYEEPIVYTQSAVGQTEADKRQLGIVDIPESYSDAVQARFFRSLDVFAVEQITPAEALELAIEKYGEGSFELSEDDFTLVDLREQEEI